MKKTKFLLLLLPLLLTSCENAPSISKEQAISHLEYYLKYNSDIDNFKDSSVFIAEERSRNNINVTTITQHSIAFNDKKDIFYYSKISQKENDPSSKETTTRWQYLVHNDNGTLSEYDATYYSHKGTVKKEYTVSTIINVESQDMHFEQNLFKDLLVMFITNNLNLAKTTESEFYYGSWMDLDLICNISNPEQNIISYYSKYNDYRIQELRYEKIVDNYNSIFLNCEFGYETFTPQMPNISEYTLI